MAIIPLPNQAGFSARLMGPIDISAEGLTAEEAQNRLSALVQEKLNAGVELRMLTIPSGVRPGSFLPDDELTQEWIQHMRDFRAEADAADKKCFDEEQGEESK